ncbi:MAG: cupredoxin domain-containing protein [Paraglaciecola chathamensis]
MKKINTWLLASLFTAIFSGSVFAAVDGHGDGHAMEGHKMSAVGMPAEKGAAPNKTITVHLMDTMKFNFSNLAGIEEGDIVKFIVMNKGKITHEFGIGSVEEQTAHRKMMQSMPNMKHEDGSTVSVAPGQSKELVWQFMGEATAQFACNVPGHFEAGMHAEVALH